MLAGLMSRQIARLIQQRLARASLPVLPLTIQLPARSPIHLGDTSTVTLYVNNRWSAWRALLSPTLVNIGEAYIDGALDVAGNIADITDCIMRLSHAVYPEYRVGRRTSLLARLLARLLSHTRRRDHEAVQYHYDISNAFYQLFLDQRMVYSCAYFRHADDTLDQAQLNKLDYILDKLRLQAGERFLDVGCGWGGLLIRAAERGAYAVGVTLSQQQFEYCQKLIAEKGLQQQCEVRLQDYRDMGETNAYDKIASVGMFEHVGLAQLENYFQQMQSLLKPQGTILMHGITSNSIENREVGLGAGEFIDRYVFPDGELPHVSLVLNAMNLAGFEVVDVESLRRHYAQTLTLWSQRLDAHANRAVELAGEQRYRIWRAYLAGCAYGFSHDWMNVYQLLACKRGQLQQYPFPMTRDALYVSSDKTNLVTEHAD